MSQNLMMKLIRIRFFSDIKPDFSFFDSLWPVGIYTESNILDALQFLLSHTLFEVKII